MPQRCRRGPTPMEETNAAIAQRPRDSFLSPAKPLVQISGLETNSPKMRRVANCGKLGSVPASCRLFGAMSARFPQSQAEAA